MWNVLNFIANVLFSVLFVIVVFLVCTLTGTVAHGADDWDFFKESPPEMKSEKRVKVYYFTAPGCVHCKTLKADAVGLPAYNFIESETPDWVESFPSLMWEDSRGRWVRFVGWSRSGFLKKMEESQKKSKVKTATSSSPGTTTAKGYPVGPIRWNVDGYDSVGKDYLINHLLTAPDHVGDFTREYLETLTVRELRSLHDDDHDGVIRSEFLPNNKQEPKTKPAASYYYPATRRGRRLLRRRGGCPGGVCP